MNEKELEEFDKLKKQNQMLDYKLKNSLEQRERLQGIMEETRALLETVSAERMTELKKKQLELFTKFVPMDFLKSLSKDVELDIVLGDYVERTMTVLFSDIVSFTSLSESMSPKDNFNFVNGYLCRVEPAIRKNGGFIDKFIGDGIMALFYEPEHAIRASIDMQRALAEYNLQRVKCSYSPVNMGIGMHTGHLMLGIIGVQERMQSTVISDAVNLASRIESLTRYYHSAALISADSIEKIEKKEFDFRFLGKVQVTGKTNAIDIFEILNAEKFEIFEKKMAAKAPFEEGLQLYFAKKFAQASHKFADALIAFPEDKAALNYLKKSTNLSNSDIPGDWTGVDVINLK